MPLCQRLKSFLDDHHVHYTVTVHTPAYTAQRVAERAHVHGEKMVKPVMVRIDGEHTMVVTTANDRIDVSKLRTALHAHDAVLEHEREFAGLFRDCDLGAMPPFGNLYGMAVYACGSLAEQAEIAFNAGRHTEIITMRYADFERLVRPRVAQFARHRTRERED